MGRGSDDKSSEREDQEDIRRTQGGSSASKINGGRIMRERRGEERR